MCAERLHFNSEEMKYHTLLAAEHASRYLFAAPSCVGRRVLDVACGEGYGTWLIAESGAAEVVGVDLDAGAVSVARERFSHDKAEFLVGDALDLPRLLDGRPKFDVIVSFETIEHISDTGRFLQAVKDVLAPGGMVFISCPNDLLEAEDGISNPYHCRVYTLAEFQQVTTSVLGPATAWHLGTPLQGIAIAEDSSRLMQNDSRELSLMVSGLEKTAEGRLLPVQADHRVLPDACSFYIGVWGASPSPVQVAAPMSRRAYMDPFKATDWYRSELERANARLEDMTGRLADATGQLAAARDENAALDEQVMRSRQRALAHARAIEAAREEAAGVQAELNALRGSRTYRLMQAYARLYDKPGIGPVLRRARRLAGRVIRAVSGHRN